MEEASHVLERGLLEILVRADHVSKVRMRVRVEELDQALIGAAVRDILDALPPFVAHHLPLRVELLLIDGVEQKAHPIALQPERQLEAVRRHGLEVVGAIPVGRAVQVRRAVALEQGEDGPLVSVEVLASLEHEVLEQVREAAASLALVHRADVVPDVHRHQRSAVIFREDHRQPVGQLILLEGNLRQRRGGDQDGCEHARSLMGSASSGK